MKIFVTGASGFIGRAVLPELIAKGHRVIGLSRSEKNTTIIRSLGAETHQGSLTDLKSLQTGAQEADAVIHLAFNHDFANFDFAEWCRMDQDAIKAMGEVLKGTNKTFITTSGVLLLPSGRKATEDDTADPENPIALMRGPSEGLTLDLAKEGVKAMVIRLAPTNHGEEDHGFIRMFFNTAREKGVSGYPDEGKNRWSAVQRLDTARLYVKALEKGHAGGIYHAVAEEGVTMKAIAEAIGSKLELPVKSIPEDQLQEHFGDVSFAMRNDSPCSSQKTQIELEWKPIEKTLAESIADGSYTA